MAQVVIEVNGGVVQQVYTHTKGIKVVLVDYDEINMGGKPSEFIPAEFAAMDPETLKHVAQVNKQSKKAR